MSSVQRFLRQVPLATTYYNSQGVIANAGTTVFEFVPSSANVVGNYPPGYMQTPSLALQTAIAAAGTVSVLRDMGKTIRAPLGSLTGDVGTYRQVQLLLPADVSTYIGGLSGSSNGVLGAAATPDNYTNYLTFYVRAPVGGQGLAAAAAAALYPVAGGQM